MIRLLPWMLVIGLTVYTLVDCAQTSDDAVRSLPKLVWVLLILVFPVVGAIAWLIAGRPERPYWQQQRRGPRGPGGTGGAAGPRRPGDPPRPPRGPDDDPDFLRRL